MRILRFITLLLFVTTKLFAQTSTYYHIDTKDGLCSQTIILFSDGTYNYERGCEATSHFSFGNWVQKKDTIIFKEANNQKFAVIKGFTSKKVDGNDIVVKIFDNKGQNITARTAVGQYVKRSGVYNLVMDSTKTAASDFKRDGAMITMKSLQNLFGQPVQIPTDSSNYYEIILNIPGNWIYQSGSDWAGTGNFKLLKTKQGLISLRPDMFDEKDHLIKTVLKEYPAQHY